MTAMPVTSVRRRLGSAAVAVLLVGALSACSEAALEVGETTVDAAGQAPSSSAPVEAAQLVSDPALQPVRTDVGAFSLQLPLGWVPIEGLVAVTSEDTATAGGAATYTSVPAAGKDQATWLSEVMAGGSSVTGVDGDLSALEPITQADGREVFHLAQAYADNRAHLYGYVEGDVLHLLRFGLDGTQETVELINRSVATGVYVMPAAVPATPAVSPDATPMTTPMTTPAPATPAATP